MAQANHGSGEENNKQFPLLSFKNADSGRYGGGITMCKLRIAVDEFTDVTPRHVGWYSTWVMSLILKRLPKKK